MPRKNHRRTCLHTAPGQRSYSFDIISDTARHVNAYRRLAGYFVDQAAGIWTRRTINFPLRFPSASDKVWVDKTTLYHLWKIPMFMNSIFLFLRRIFCYSEYCASQSAQTTRNQPRRQILL